MQMKKNVLKKQVEAVFKFNQTLDNAIIEPIAKGYNKLPEPIKNGTGNFTSNITFILTFYTKSSLQGNV